MSSTKLPSHRFLDDQSIPYRALSFPVEIDKGAASVARQLGFLERQMVKSLIFETGEGEQLLVLIGGDQKAISGHLKKAVGSRNVRMASLETIKRVTGYEVGSIPPFHWQPKGFRTLLERSLTEEEELGVGAGQWGQEIIIAPADLVKATGATIVNLTDRSRPVFETD